MAKKTLSSTRKSKGKSEEKKVAMVAPPPKNPAIQAAFQGSDPTLEQVLKDLGNDRSYSILGTFFNGWSVHFEGDTAPSFVKYKQGKWVITDR